MHEIQQSRAFWVTGPKQGELRSSPLSSPRENEVLVETLYSAISRGTESLVYRGDVPPSEYQRMRAPFQTGDFPSPVKYGYCNVGTVIEGPPTLRGKHVFCLHPHQDRYVVPASAVHCLPDGVPPGRAVLTANLETAINGIWDGAVGPGDRVTIIGAGVVGCLVAVLVAQIPGVDVEVVDIDERKSSIVAAMGLRFSSPSSARSECDVVFEASGHPSGLATSLALTGPEATIVTLSWYGTHPVTIPLGEAFHAHRLRIVSSQVGSIPAPRRARWTYARRLGVALDLLTDAKLGPVVDHLFADDEPFDELPRVMAELSQSDRVVLCQRIVYR